MPPTDKLVLSPDGLRPVGDYAPEGHRGRRNGFFMKIGVISDTHGYVTGEVHTLFKGVDLILHAGDIGDESVIFELETIAKVEAVSGNDDYHLYDRYPWDKLINFQGFKIILCHWYDNFGMIHPKISKDIQVLKPDVLVYGHTHFAVNETKGGVLYFNPGYAGADVGKPARSVGILQSSDKVIKGQVIYL